MFRAGAKDPVHDGRFRRFRLADGPMGNDFLDLDLRMVA
jgi:hypothetical protein